MAATGTGIGRGRAAIALIFVVVVVVGTLSLVGCGTDVEVTGDCKGAYICPPGIDGPWKPSLSKSGNDCVLDGTFILGSDGELQDRDRKPVGTWSTTDKDIQLCVETQKECITCDVSNPAPDDG